MKSKVNPIYCGAFLPPPPPDFNILAKSFILGEFHNTFGNQNPLLKISCQKLKYQPFEDLLRVSIFCSNYRFQMDIARSFSSLKVHRCWRCENIRINVGDDYKSSAGVNS
jgi:hypothetical protein